MAIENRGFRLAYATPVLISSTKVCPLKSGDKDGDENGVLISM